MSDKQLVSIAGEEYSFPGETKDVEIEAFLYKNRPDLFPNLNEEYKNRVLTQAEEIATRRQITTETVENTPWYGQTFGPTLLGLVDPELKYNIDQKVTSALGYVGVSPFKQYSTLGKQALEDSSKPPKREGTQVELIPVPEKKEKYAGLPSEDFQPFVEGEKGTENKVTTIEPTPKKLSPKEYLELQNLKELEEEDKKRLQFLKENSKLYQIFDAVDKWSDEVLEGAKAATQFMPTPASDVEKFSDLANVRKLLPVVAEGLATTGAIAGLSYISPKIPGFKYAPNLGMGATQSLGFVQAREGLKERYPDMSDKEVNKLAVLHSIPLAMAEYGGTAIQMGAAGLTKGGWISAKQIERLSKSNVGKVFAGIVESRSGRFFGGIIAEDSTEFFQQAYESGLITGKWPTFDEWATLGAISTITAGSFVGPGVLMTPKKRPLPSLDTLGDLDTKEGIFRGLAKEGPQSSSRILEKVEGKAPLFIPDILEEESERPNKGWDLEEVIPKQRLDSLNGIDPNFYKALEGTKLLEKFANSEISLEELYTYTINTANGILQNEKGEFYLPKEDRAKLRKALNEDLIPRPISVRSYMKDGEDQIPTSILQPQIQAMKGYIAQASSPEDARNRIGSVNIALEMVQRGLYNLAQDSGYKSVREMQEDLDTKGTPLEFNVVTQEYLSNLKESLKDTPAEMSEGETRGFYIPPQFEYHPGDGEFLISLTENIADPSTLLEETIHFFKDRVNPKTKTYKLMEALTNKELKRQGQFIPSLKDIHPIKDGNWGDVHEEVWASTLLQYLSFGDIDQNLTKQEKVMLNAFQGEMKRLLGGLYFADSVFTKAGKVRKDHLSGDVKWVFEQMFRTEKAPEMYRSFEDLINESFEDMDKEMPNPFETADFTKAPSFEDLTAPDVLKGKSGIETKPRNFIPLQPVPDFVKEMFKGFGQEALERQRTRRKKDVSPVRPLGEKVRPGIFLSSKQLQGTPKEGSISLETSTRLEGKRARLRELIGSEEGRTLKVIGKKDKVFPTLMDKAFYLYGQKGFETFVKSKEVQAAFLPPVPPGMIRLYRVEAKNQMKDAEIPNWMKDDEGYIKLKKAAGRWYTDDLNEVDWYINFAKNNSETPQVFYIDVTRNQLENYRVQRSPEAAKFSRRPEKEFFIPQDLKDTRVKLDTDSVRNRVEQELIKLTDVPNKEDLLRVAKEYREEVKGEEGQRNIKSSARVKKLLEQTGVMKQLPQKEYDDLKAFRVKLIELLEKPVYDEEDVVEALAEYFDVGIYDKVSTKELVLIHPLSIIDEITTRKTLHDFTSQLKTQVEVLKYTNFILDLERSVKIPTKTVYSNDWTRYGSWERRGNYATLNIPAIVNLKAPKFNISPEAAIFATWIHEHVGHGVFNKIFKDAVNMIKFQSALEKFAIKQKGLPPSAYDTKEGKAALREYLFDIIQTEGYEHLTTDNLISEAFARLVDQLTVEDFEKLHKSAIWKPIEDWISTSLDKIFNTYINHIDKVVDLSERDIDAVVYHLLHSFIKGEDIKAENKEIEGPEIIDDPKKNPFYKINKKKAPPAKKLRGILEQTVKKEEDLTSPGGFGETFHAAPEGKEYHPGTGINKNSTFIPGADALYDWAEEAEVAYTYKVSMNREEMDRAGAYFLKDKKAAKEIIDKALNNKGLSVQEIWGIHALYIREGIRMAEIIRWGKVSEEKAKAMHKKFQEGIYKARSMAASNAGRNLRAFQAILAWDTLSELLGLLKKVVKDPKRRQILTQITPNVLIELESLDIKSAKQLTELLRGLPVGKDGEILGLKKYQQYLLDSIDFKDEKDLNEQIFGALQAIKYNSRLKALLVAMVYTNLLSNPYGRVRDFAANSYALTWKMSAGKMSEYLADWLGRAYYRGIKGYSRNQRVFAREIFAGYGGLLKPSTVKEVVKNSWTTLKGYNLTEHTRLNEQGTNFQMLINSMMHGEKGVVRGASIALGTIGNIIRAIDVGTRIAAKNVVLAQFETKVAIWDSMGVREKEFQRMRDEWLDTHGFTDPDERVKMNEALKADPLRMLRTGFNSFMDDVTFQGRDPITESAMRIRDKIDDMVMKVPGIGYLPWTRLAVMTFMRTPAALLRMALKSQSIVAGGFGHGIGLNYFGVGGSLAQLTLEAYRNRNKGGKVNWEKTIMKVIDSQIQAHFIMLTLSYLLAQGWIQPPPEPGEEVDKRKPPFSIRVMWDNQPVWIQLPEPLGSIMSPIIHSLWRIQKYGELDENDPIQRREVGEAVNESRKLILNGLLNNSFIGEIVNFNPASPEKGLPYKVSSLLPFSGFVRWLVDTNDMMENDQAKNWVTEIQPGDRLPQFTQKVVTNYGGRGLARWLGQTIPQLEAEIPEQINIFGTPKSRAWFEVQIGSHRWPAEWLPFPGLLGSKVSTVPKLEDPVEAELYKLGVQPPIPGDQFLEDGVEVHLSPEIHTSFKLLTGEYFMKTMRRKIYSPSYKRRNVNERIEMVDKIYDEARDKAKKDTLKHYRIQMRQAKREDREYIYLEE